MVLTLEQIRQLAQAVGFPDVATAAAVAMAESGGDACARGDPHSASDCTNAGGPSTSFGLWQIHVPAHPEYSAPSLYDPLYNAHAAYAISTGGTIWTPWSTYTSGVYRQFLDGPVAPPPAPASAGVTFGDVVLTIGAGLVLGALGARFAPALLRRLVVP